MNFVRMIEENRIALKRFINLLECRQRRLNEEKVALMHEYDTRLASFHDEQIKMEESLIQKYKDIILCEE